MRFRLPWTAWDSTFAEAPPILYGAYLLFALLLGLAIGFAPLVVLGVVSVVGGLAGVGFLARWLGRVKDFAGRPE